MGGMNSVDFGAASMFATDDAVDGSAAHGAPVARVAAIDIGTVTCRMLVADVDAAGGMHELAREYAIANLGEGVDSTHRLKPEAIERVVAIVKRYLAKLDELCRPETNPAGLSPTVYAVATSASRDAENSDEFAARLRELGVEVRVIPGQREAALSFAGATSEFPGEQVIVVDVGGGSTEVIAGAAGRPPVRSRSFDIGCRRVTERFLKSDPPAAAELQAATEWIRDEMQPYFQELRAAGLLDCRMVAVAGTATTAVSIRERMAKYDSSRVHKAVVTDSDLASIRQDLAAMPISARRETVGLDPDRAPVIVAGFLILQVVMELAGASSFTVSESDILQGIVLLLTAE